MQSSTASTATDKASVALARAFGGAIIFALPLLMTMEMWSLGFSMDRMRLAFFLVAALPLLGGLSYYAGFEETFCWQDSVREALVAYAVGFAAAAAILLLLAVLEPRMATEEVVGKIALQAVPAAIGAMLARSLLGQQDEEKAEKRRQGTYAGELFLAGTGALFVAFNVAPTEEIILIASMMSVWHGLAMILLSLAMMHAFVYAVEFRGQASRRRGSSVWSEFLRLTIVAYALALLISAYVLWTFGRTMGLSWEALTMAVIVLGFPAALGAAAARLIL